MQSSDQRDRTTMTVPDFISPSKPGNSEISGTDPSTRASKVAFKLGHSKQESSIGFASIEVIFISNRFQRSDALSSPFYGSRSPPNGLMSTVNRRPMSRSTSYKRCPLFYEPVPTKYRKRTVLLTPRDRLRTNDPVWGRPVDRAIAVD